MMAKSDDRSGGGGDAGVREALGAGSGRADMRSPDEHEAAFYADTTNANPDTTVKVGDPESSLR